MPQDALTAHVSAPAVAALIALEAGLETPGEIDAFLIARGLFPRNGARGVLDNLLKLGRVARLTPPGSRSPRWAMTQHGRDVLAEYRKAMTAT